MARKKSKAETEQEPGEEEQDKKRKSEELGKQGKAEEKQEIKIIFPEELGEAEEEESEESLEQEVEEYSPIFDDDNFPRFVSSERKSSLLEAEKSLQQIPDTNIEEIAQTAPPTEKQEQTGYLINAPDYSGSTDYSQLSRDEQEVVSRRDREINMTPALMRREIELSGQPQNINFRTWQQTEGEMSRISEEENYEIRVREREKKKDKLPFQ